MALCFICWSGFCYFNKILDTIKLKRENMYLDSVSAYLVSWSYSFWDSNEALHHGSNTCHGSW